MSKIELQLNKKCKILYEIFKSHCRNYVMPTYAPHEENSIEFDAQNPNHTSPKIICFCCMINAG